MPGACRPDVVVLLGLDVGGLNRGRVLGIFRVHELRELSGRGADRIDTLVEQFLAHIGPLIDVRSPGKLSSALLQIPDHPQEEARRVGHIHAARPVK